MRKNNKKGFTLAELLIVVAIIAVLVAIAIPIFTTQLEKSRDAVTMSNVRSAYAQAAAEVLSSQNAATGSGTSLVSADYEVVVKGKSGTGDAFTGTDLPFTLGTGVAAALDKADDTGKIQVHFTWTMTNGEANQTPTCDLKTTTTP